MRETSNDCQHRSTETSERRAGLCTIALFRIDPAEAFAKGRGTAGKSPWPRLLRRGGPREIADARCDRERTANPLRVVNPTCTAGQRGSLKRVSDALNTPASPGVQARDGLRPQQDLRKIAQQAGGTPSGGVLHFDAQRRRARSCSLPNNRLRQTGMCGLG
jgi:hypothetical protein